MADSKVTALTETTTPAASSPLYIVDGGNPRKVQRTNLLYLPSGIDDTVTPVSTTSGFAALNMLANFIKVKFGLTHWYDAVVALFDSTAPVTQAFGDAAAAGSATIAARRDHKHGMMAAPSGGNPNALKVITASVTVANSSAETTVATFTVPGDTLGTANMIRGQCYITMQNNSGGDSTFTIKVKYGGTLVLTYALGTLGTNAQIYSLPIKFWLKATGATNTQLAFSEPLVKGIESNTNVAGVVNAAPIPTTAAIDSTANADLIITVQHNVANANATCTMRMATFEVLTAI